MLNFEELTRSGSTLSASAGRFAMRERALNTWLPIGVGSPEHATETISTIELAPRLDVVYLPEFERFYAELDIETRLPQIVTRNAKRGMTKC